MLAGRIRYLLSVALLAEYRSVLLRPGIQKRHGLTDDEIDRILEVIAANGIFRDPDLDGVDCPDPGDAHVWALLENIAGAVLVTGDQALVDAGGRTPSVLSPASFAATFIAEG
jgi:predicted nucleic acid-binding protein